jgi:electron transport complex protein RnfC
MGQKIGDIGAPVSAPIHASVSGKVVAIEPRLNSNGTKVNSVVIENDGLDTPDESLLSLGTDLNDPDAIVKLIREAGMWYGRATFPTAFKKSQAERERSIRLLLTAPNASRT